MPSNVDGATTSTGEPRPEPDSELEAIQRQAYQVTGESLDSTRRILVLCEESREAGIRTLVDLDEQGEQLDHIEDDTDRLNVDMREAEANISAMEKFCGLCFCPCNKMKRFKEDTNAWKPEGEEGKVVSGQPIHVVDERNGSTLPITTSYIAKITQDGRENEMEENMMQTHTMIGNLRNMAIDIGCEINAQTHQLEPIDQKVDSNENRIHAANVRAQKLVK